MAIFKKLNILKLSYRGSSHCQKEVDNQKVTNHRGDCSPRGFDYRQLLFHFRQKTPECRYRQRITISEVKKGAFQETIPINGVVLPITTIYLDAHEGGRVEEKFVEDGAVMKKGQPILRLSNPDPGPQPGKPGNQRCTTCLPRCRSPATTHSKIP